MLGPRIDSVLARTRAHARLRPRTHACAHAHTGTRVCKRTRTHWQELLRALDYDDDHDDPDDPPREHYEMHILLCLSYNGSTRTTAPTVWLLPLFACLPIPGNPHMLRVVY